MTWSEPRVLVCVGQRVPPIPTKSVSKRRALELLRFMQATPAVAYPSLPPFEHDAIARRLGMRPLKPPPLPDWAPPPASAVALERDRKLGLGGIR